VEKWLQEIGKCNKLVKNMTVPISNLFLKKVGIGKNNNTKENGNFSIPVMSIPKKTKILIFPQVSPSCLFSALPLQFVLVYSSLLTRSLLGNFS
jgi:hypothetical protein